MGLHYFNAGAGLENGEALLLSSPQSFNTIFWLLVALQLYPNLLIDNPPQYRAPERPESTTRTREDARTAFPKKLDLQRAAHFNTNTSYSLSLCTLTQSFDGD